MGYPGTCWKLVDMLLKTYNFSKSLKMSFLPILLLFPLYLVLPIRHGWRRLESPTRKIQKSPAHSVKKFLWRAFYRRRERRVYCMDTPLPARVFVWVYHRNFFPSGSYFWIFHPWCLARSECQQGSTLQPPHLYALSLFDFLLLACYSLSTGELPESFE